jgi:hypothetical protein
MSDRASPDLAYIRAFAQQWNIQRDLAGALPLCYENAGATQPPASPGRRQRLARFVLGLEVESAEPATVEDAATGPAREID